MEIDKEPKLLGTGNENRLKNLVASYNSGTTWQLDNEMRLFILKKLNMGLFEVNGGYLLYAQHPINRDQSDDTLEVRHEDEFNWAIKDIRNLEKYLIILKIQEAVDTESYSAISDDLLMNLAAIMWASVAVSPKPFLMSTSVETQLKKLMSKEQYSFFEFTKAYKQKANDEAKAKVRDTDTQQETEDIH